MTCSFWYACVDCGLQGRVSVTARKPWSLSDFEKVARIRAERRHLRRVPACTGGPPGSGPAIRLDPYGASARQLVNSESGERSYSDLKLLDELLVDLKDALRLQWPDVERHSSVTRDAMARLRAARASGEMRLITLSLAKYFGEDCHDA